MTLLEHPHLTCLDQHTHFLQQALGLGCGEVVLVEQEDDFTGEFGFEGFLIWIEEKGSGVFS